MMKRRTNLQNRKSNPFFLITVPGETEKRYFSDWASARRLPNVRLEIVHDSNPSQALRKAELRRRILSANRLWILLDYDNPSHRETERRRNFDALCVGDKPKVYYANPCFEVWVLMHFERFAKPDDSCGLIVKYLKKYLPDYRKGEAYPVFDKIKNNEPTATSNADFLLAQHLQSGNLQPSDRIPSTTIHRILESLHNPETDNAH